MFQGLIEEDGYVIDADARAQFTEMLMRQVEERNDFLAALPKAKPNLRFEVPERNNGRRQISYQPSRQSGLK
jgi:hypothetical protein